MNLGKLFFNSLNHPEYKHLALGSSQEVPLLLQSPSPPSQLNSCDVRGSERNLVSELFFLRFISVYTATELMRYIGKNGQDQFELSIGQQSSLLLRFIVWPFSWLVELVLNHVSELPEYLVLPLHPLLLAEHGKRPLLVRRINLVFFPQPEQKVSQLK